MAGESLIMYSARGTLPLTYAVTSHHRANNPYSISSSEELMKHIIDLQPLCFLLVSFFFSFFKLLYPVLFLMSPFSTDCLPAFSTLPFQSRTTEAWKWPSWCEQPPGTSWVALTILSLSSPPIFTRASLWVTRSREMRQPCSLIASELNFVSLKLALIFPALRRTDSR